MLPDINKRKKNKSQYVKLRSFKQFFLFTKILIKFILNNSLIANK